MLVDKHWPHKSEFWILNYLLVYLSFYLTKKWGWKYGVDCGKYSTYYGAAGLLCPSDSLDDYQTHGGYFHLGSELQGSGI